MIQIPAGFDAAVLMSEFFYFALPFVGLCTLFAGYRVIKRVIYGR